MRVAVFDTHGFERPYFERANLKFKHEVTFLDVKLKLETAALAQGFDVVCPFVNDHLNEAVLQKLRMSGTRLIALRSAGFNHVDLEAAQRLGLTVVRVPRYSPYAVAEYTVAMILSLNRKIYKSYLRVREGNFSLDGLVGFDLHGKTVGVMGTGKIGAVMAKILKGFGCEVLAHDVQPSQELARVLKISYVDPNEIYSQADIISLHVPLTPQTQHMIDHKVLSLMKPGVMLINTGRGGLIDTRALIDALKSGHVGAAGLDVYEEEENLFFQDLSAQVIQDDLLARLLTFPNVLITSHQAFLTREALVNIAETTLQNIADFADNKPLLNEVVPQEVVCLQKPIPLAERLGYGNT